MLSRRDLLVAGAAVASRPLWALEKGSFEFAFFSDTHVGLKANIEQNRAMLAEITARKPAFAINGGDVTDYGWRGEYANYRKLIEPLPYRIRHVAGNHDVRWSPLGPKAFKEGTHDPLYQAFTHEGCRFYLLDSTVPLSHYGHFEAEMLRWLAADLKRVGPETPVFVFTHHWIGRDRIMVDNEEKLLAILEPYNVKHVFNGHGHSDLLWTWDELPNTMNKGLYQGSWMWVEVDRAKDEVRIARRAGKPEKGGASPVALWSASLSKKWKRTGAGAEGAQDQIRYDDGAWFIASDTTKLAADPALHIHGVHRKTTRRGESYRTSEPLDWVVEYHPLMNPVWETPLAGGVMSHLLLDGDALYVSQMDGSLWRLDAATGKPVWKVKTGGYCHSSPVRCGNLIVVGSADGSVHAFDQRSGARKWQAKTGGPVYASATYAKGLVIIGSGDGIVYGLDPSTGQAKWRFALPKSDTAFVQSPAATDGERVFLGAWDKHIYALDAVTGELLWRQNAVGERSFAYSAAIGGPCVHRGRVYVPSNGNILWSFDAKTGTPVWRTESPGDKFGYSSPTVRDGRVYVGCLGDKGEVRCVDAADGKILWTAATGSGIYDSGPALGEDWLAIGSVSGRLNVIDLSSGRIRAQVQLPSGHFLSTPAARGDELYVATYGDFARRYRVA
ncbi:hypothetical protein EON81_18580 [bacterium]|nr:MAG: hypothetical protein EON81_18580 [bacterium]